MAADHIQQDQPSAETERERWQAPRVTRFAAAGARAGENAFNGADGETSKS